MQNNTPKQNLSYQSSDCLSRQLKPDHELLKLAKLIPWDQFEYDFQLLLSEGQSRSPLLVRLAAGLIILQHLFKITDEQIIQAWAENPYWQAFCGYELFQWELPVHLSTLTKWRRKIGAEGIEKILQIFNLVTSQTKIEYSNALCESIAFSKTSEAIQIPDSKEETAS
jgi:IS5 family transposase